MASGGGGGGGSEGIILDDVFKRRLLIDGDGVGDDKRIIALTKSLITFTGTEDSCDDESDIMYRRLITQLKQVEFGAKRTFQCINISLDTKAAYDEFGTQVKQEIDETRKQIIDSKVVLEEATKLRKCSMEYDALGKLIQSKPDREETDNKCIKLTAEFEQLNKRRQTLETQLAQRQRNIEFMTSEITKLREITKDDDELDKSITAALLDDEAELARIAVIQAQLNKSKAIAGTDSGIAVSNGKQGTSIVNGIYSKIIGSDGSGSNSPMDTLSPPRRLLMDHQIPMESNHECEFVGSPLSLGSYIEIHNIRGTVSSAPLSPVDKSSVLENYEDLSEEEVDDENDGEIHSQDS